MPGNRSPRSAEGAVCPWRVVGSILGGSILVLVALLQRRQLVGVELAKGLASRTEACKIEAAGMVTHLHKLEVPDPVHGDNGSVSQTWTAVSGSRPDAAASCSLAVEQSPLADSCTLLRDACVDQGTIILYRREDAKRLLEAEGPGFELIEPQPGYDKFSFVYRSNGAHDKRFHTNAIRVRPAATDEGAAYLQDPHFSSCTVPVVWYAWERATNFAHVFRDNGAELLGVLRDTPWWQHAKLVMVTAEGLALPPWNHDILQPLLSLKVETWADFSTRLPAQQAASGSGYVPAGDGCGGLSDVVSGDVGLPLSSEGGPQRCFQHMLVCNGGVNHSAWPLHGMGQHLVRHYQRLLPAAIQQLHEQERQPQQGSLEEEEEEEEEDEVEVEVEEEEKQDAQHQELRDDGCAGTGSLDGQVEGRPCSGTGGSYSHVEPKERVLRVLFQKRSGPDRQLLNAGELIQQCNSWRYTSKAGQQLRASCAEVEVTSLLTGMAAAQDANVFVGVHGANMANAWFMRPGSSMVELHPYGFDESPAHLQYPLANAKDDETAVLWWLISVCDPDYSTPGTEEAQGEGSKRKWAKNRNVQVGWSALREVLETAVDVGGNMTEYRQRWQEGRWWWWLGRGGELTMAGPGRFIQMRCPKEGEDIDTETTGTTEA